jgi:hypothetical protein
MHLSCSRVQGPAGQVAVSQSSYNREKEGAVRHCGN